MKTLPLLFIFSFLFFLSGFAQVGIGTASPHSSAMLEVNSANKGLLVSQMALTATNVALPVAGPATGLLVYNTATAGSGSTAVVPGFYYWNGTAWTSLYHKGGASGDMLYWNGSQWMVLTGGTEGAVLTFCSGVPTWGGCPVTLTLQPAGNTNEGGPYSYAPTTSDNGNKQITVSAWTMNGSPIYARGFLKFNYTLPAGATITSAKLSLYATPTPQAGNLTDAHSGSANAMYLQRITSSWTGSTLTWNNQPTTTTVNQITIPNSTSSFQDNVDIDVTQLVKDMQQFGNNGFAMRLVA